MRAAGASLLTLWVGLCLAGWGQGVPGILHPPGAQAEEKAQRRFEKDMPPPPQVRSAPSPQQLQREADELVGLAQSVPSQIQQVQRDVLPKELIDKLKRIEKLSKQLRSELSQR